MTRDRDKLLTRSVLEEPGYCPFTVKDLDKEMEQDKDIDKFLDQLMPFPFY